ncbi:hypothetical protein HZY97_08530 [Sphingomonas sp. R-74633]|uniref:hypothetical protein n=1 Tax=Sphingomonas sp. R-74633 TaxID=2751188 RepID=UPI0015D2B032|nr:hypothetical protein [Sphingomonas sp. R-74633]NYT40798.1 hypothetical protein [Sphingomonas sp. R-74633]
MSDTPEDDPLDPRRWTARGGEGGPITGDEYAYLKDLVHSRMGVGNCEPDPLNAPPLAPKRGWWRRLRERLRFR